jgi:hypothetical protein
MRTEAASNPTCDHFGFSCRQGILPDLSNSDCLPGRAGGTPVGLGTRGGSAGTGTSPPSARHAPRVFDVHPTTGAAKTIDGAPGGSGSDDPPAPTVIPQTPEKLLGFLDQISHRSRMRTSVPLPEGARFETMVYADAVGRLQAVHPE